MNCSTKGAAQPLTLEFYIELMSSFWLSYKPGQKNQQKVKKSGKIGRDKKNLMSPFA